MMQGGSIVASDASDGTPICLNSALVIPSHHQRGCVLEALCAKILGAIMPSSPSRSSLPLHDIINSACTALEDVVVAPLYKFAELPTELLLLILDIGAASSRPFCLTLSLVSHGIRRLANRHLYRTLDERLLLWLREHRDKGDGGATSNANEPSSFYRDLATLSYTFWAPPRQNTVLADALVNVNLLKSPSGSPSVSRIVRLRSSLEDDLKAIHGLSISLAKLIAVYPNVKNVAISLVELVHALHPQRRRSTQADDVNSDNNTSGSIFENQFNVRTNGIAAAATNEASGVQLIVDVSDPRVWDELEQVYRRYQQQQQPGNESGDESQERLWLPHFTSAISRIHLTGFPINTRILLMLSTFFPSLTHLAASFCWTRALDELLTGSSSSDSTTDAQQQTNSSNAGNSASALEQYLPNLEMLVIKLMRNASDMVWLGEPERVGRVMNEDGSPMLVHVRSETRIPTAVHYLTGQRVYVLCDAWPGTAPATWAEAMESRDVFEKARGDTVGWLARRGRQH